MGGCTPAEEAPPHLGGTIPHLKETQFIWGSPVSRLEDPYPGSGSCTPFRGAVPHFEAGEGILHGALVVLHHVGVHVGVVAADVPLGAAVGDGAEAEGGVLLLRLLKL